MPSSQSPPPMSRLGELRHGIGEILGFAAAAMGAVVDLLSGRWPELSERRGLRRTDLQAPETADDRAAPDPAQEG